MNSWYYVQGTERMGPVDEKALKQLFTEGIIQNDSYVWTKGFANWERLHRVKELKYFIDTVENILEVKQSPQIDFNFDWEKINFHDEIFYILIGNDRHNEEDILGPYSLKELYGAFIQKRINEKTLVYTPGMVYWERLGAISTIRNLWKIGSDEVSLFEQRSPGLIVIDRQPVPIISTIKKMNGNLITILCSQHLVDREILLATLYKNEKLQIKNIKLKVISINNRNQAIDCEIYDLDAENIKIMNTCAA
jgi:hypothetical protein